jgi:hypothetical protein
MLQEDKGRRLSPNSLQKKSQGVKTSEFDQKKDGAAKVKVVKFYEDMKYSVGVGKWQKKKSIVTRIQSRDSRCGCIGMSLVWAAIELGLDSELWLQGGAWLVCLLAGSSWHGCGG